MPNYDKAQCEFLRYQAKQRFERVKLSWIECGKWTLPHRARVLLAQEEGSRVNNHIFDPTHILALRSYVAGFLEGNTSASRPWYRVSHPDADLNKIPSVKEWLDIYTRRTLITLSNSNFYYSAGLFYYDLGTFSTGAQYIDETQTGLHFHNLTPGTYFCLNNNLGIADILVREFSLTVKALVDQYGRKDENGNWMWGNFSERVKKMYQDGNYTHKVDVVHIIKPNPDYNPSAPPVLLNRPWLALTYEIGTTTGQYYEAGQEVGPSSPNAKEAGTYLKISAYKRKPFIIGRGDASENFEYGEKGPTLDALGLIKSLNKKAVGKDIALDHMLKPPLQGPAHLKKSYITNQPNSYVPLDAQSMAQGGLKPIFQVDPRIAALNQDINDLRSQVEKLYYSDYLLYLTRNPKTRTAAETNAVVQEQQLIIGPMLQSLNWTYNNPLIEFVMDYVLDEDPYLPPPPPELEGEFLRTEFISVFAQSQKAADLPVIDRFIEMVTTVGQLNPQIYDKANLDKLADLYEDRLYLPPGLVNPQSKVDAMREKRAVEQQRQQMLQETAPAMAAAAKDLASLKKQQ